MNKTNSDEFYKSLAVLSIKFSEMEYKLMELLSLHITDSFVISSILFEKNSLHTNLDILRRLNDYYNNSERIKIDTLINDIYNIKDDRNLFIHGIWGEPIEIDNVIECKVSSYKVKFPPKSTIDTRRTWTKGEHKYYSLQDLNDIIQNINRIITIESEIIDHIEENEYDFYHRQ